MIQCGNGKVGLFLILAILYDLVLKFLSSFLRFVLKFLETYFAICNFAIVPTFGLAWMATFSCLQAWFITFDFFVRQATILDDFMTTSSKNNWYFFSANPFDGFTAFFWRRMSTWIKMANDVFVAYIMTVI